MQRSCTKNGAKTHPAHQRSSSSSGSSRTLIFGGRCQLGNFMASCLISSCSDLNWHSAYLQQTFWTDESLLHSSSSRLILQFGIVSFIICQSLWSVTAASIKTEQCHDPHRCFPNRTDSSGKDGTNCTNQSLQKQVSDDAIHHISLKQQHTFCIILLLLTTTFHHYKAQRILFSYDDDRDSVRVWGA